MSLTKCPACLRLNFISATSCPSCGGGISRRLTPGASGQGRESLHEKVGQHISVLSTMHVGSTPLCDAPKLGPPCGAMPFRGQRDTPQGSGSERDYTSVLRKRL